MLQKYLSYYRIFHANKLGSRTFSSWQNFPIQFGSKFKQIQQNGNAHCNILFQSQQFQRYQFFTKNVGNNDPNDLDTRILWLDTNKTKNVTLEMQKGKSGQKIFKIILNRSGLFRNVPNILVPQDAYPFVYALDQLIWEMATKNFEQKLQIQGVDIAPVEMLVRHDGTEALSIEAPAQIPQQFFQKIESTNGRTAGTWN